MEAVTIVRTGAANLASVVAAVERMTGMSPEVTNCVRTVERAQRLILPGVGAFGAAMQSLTDAKLVEPLRDRLASQRPTLAICLGLQLLAATSDESPEARGLGIIKIPVTRFDPSQRVPQMGWNSVKSDPGFQPSLNGHVYFANSFRLTECPEGWQAAWSDYGGRFIAALQRGPILACQFHPELSGQVGEQLLRSWFTQTPIETPTETPLGLQPC